MRDNPKLSTWLLIGGGAFAAYYFYVKPRMAAPAAQQPQYAPKRDWLSEVLGVVTRGAESYWRDKRDAEKDKRIRDILSGKAPPPKSPPIRVDPSMLQGTGYF